MPTDRPHSALFLFAHQDDEFGVFAAIERCVRAGLTVRCAYLTHGAGGVAARRNAESLRVLARLGVALEQVAFAGDQLGIEDASLPRHVGSAARWIGDWIERAGNVDSLYVTAWEGGHHDHDALHAAACHAAAERGLLARVRQYALYHANGLPGPLFSVLSPLAANGAVQRQPLSRAARWRYLQLCTLYPSQRKTWLGLLPAVTLRYLLQGEQCLQPVSLARLTERPHAGPLYYEKRGFYRWEQLQQDLQRAFL